MSFGAVVGMVFPLSTVHAQVPVLSPERFDPVPVALDDVARAERGDLYFYGRSLALDAHTSEYGEWVLEGDQRVWRVEVTSPGAQAIELFYDRMIMPKGAELRVSHPLGEEQFGPFTSADVFGGVFSTPLVTGDRCIVEYRVPVHVEDPGGFRITRVGHAYRDVLDGSCNIDVVCSPEGDDWESAGAGVVRISIVAGGGVGWCSGALVNNVRQDCSPYILSAWHCGAGSTAAQMNVFKFYFGYQRPNCGSGAAPSNMFLTGAQLRAFSNDNAGNSGSDFMLLEANGAIPEHFPHYFLGWDAGSLTTSAADGVCIHHPTGSPKRISTYTQTLTTGHWAPSTGLQSHWRVNWAETQNGHGVTESGSSGAPLLRRSMSGEPYVIGTLSGSTGQLSCASRGGTSFFGKFSYHWSQNPNTAALKLRNWLDPDATGTLQLDGGVSPCTTVASIAGTTGVAPLEIRYDPQGRTIRILHPDASAVRSLRLLDVSGREIKAVRLPSTAQDAILLDVGYLAPGVHHVVLRSANSHSFGRFVVSP
ncbi:MAG: trypsin-like serine peptidase [Flavobacteriales bacterium]